MEKVQLSLTLAEYELLTEAMADAIKKRSSPAPEDVKIRFDYRSLQTSMAIQKRDQKIKP